MSEIERPAVECPVERCVETPDKRGLISHLRGTHEIDDDDEIDRLVDEAQPVEESNRPASEFVDGDESFHQACVKIFSGKFNHKPEDVREAIKRVQERKGAMEDVADTITVDVLGDTDRAAQRLQEIRDELKAMEENDE